MRHSRGPMLALSAVLVLLVLVLFSRQVHGDVYDDLLDLERFDWFVNFKHPLAEPALWLVVRSARALFGPGSGLRALQLWNGAWMMAALLAVYGHARRVELGQGLAFALTFVLASTLGALHFLRDPFLYYWPPSLALSSFIGATGGSTLRRRIAAGSFGALACLFNPLLVPAVVAAMSTIFGGSRRGFAGAAAAVAALPILLLDRVAGLRALIGGQALYGQWRPEAPIIASAALGETLIARWGLVLGVLGLAFALGALIASLASRRWLSAAPFFAAAAATACLIAWWDPAQTYFWLIVPWLWVLGIIEARPAVSARAERAVIAFGAVLGLVNCWTYVLPTSHGEDQNRVMARELGAAIGERDLVVFPDFAEGWLEYYAGRKSTGWVALHASLEPGGRTFGLLLETYAHARDGNARVWVEVDERQRPILPEHRIDLTRSELSRISWGPGVRAKERQFRQVRDIQREAPCASAKNGVRVRGGFRVSASHFDERELNRDYAPELAFDGRPLSEWLCAAAPSDVLDVSFDFARPVRTVRLMNARNPPYLDHSTSSYRVEAWHHGELVAESDGELAPSELPRRFHDVPLAAAAVDCVRVVVLGHRGAGGGLAEIELR